jgi:hypothetical protein
LLRAIGQILLGALSGLTFAFFFFVSIDGFAAVTRRGFDSWVMYIPHIVEVIIAWRLLSKSELFAASFLGAALISSSFGAMLSAFAQGFGPPS